MEMITFLLQYIILIFDDLLYKYFIICVCANNLLILEKHNFPITLNFHAKFFLKFQNFG